RRDGVAAARLGHGDDHDRTSQPVARRRRPGPRVARRPVPTGRPTIRRQVIMQPSSRRRRWVLIETGGNQRYIFGSSRLRHVVGASQLVHEVGTGWVPEAVDACGLSDDTVVMTASGKALLLVDSREAGRAVVREVTRRALREAPGLRVTGVVGPEFDPQAPMAHERARAETYGQMPLVRAARPSLQNRDRVFPWHELCRYSGQPAACRERYGGDEPPVPTAAAMLARSRARDRAY